MQRILLICSYLASLFVHVIAYQYIGCYKDSLSKPLFNGLGQKGPYINLDLSTAACVDYCAERKFSYMAVQNGIMCYCSNVLPTEAPVNSSYCDVSCPNDPVEQCGGLAYDSVYSSFVPDHTLSHDSVPNFLSPQMPATVEQRRPVSPYIVAIYCVVAFIVICFLAFFVYIWRMARKRTVPLEETKEFEKCERRSLWSQSFVDKFRHYSTRRGKIDAPV
ncbi:WSC domain-containing protein [Umbelopsis sp. AD052]|nr:WSC domain-containing protein [Umbelopsis sp. AD052]